MNHRLLIAAATLLMPAAALGQYPPAPAPPPPPRDPPQASVASSDSTSERLPDPPTYPRYLPPDPELRPNPPIGRQMLQRAGAQSGLLLSLGLQRDLSAGAELQLRLARNLGVGLGGQAGAAFGNEVTCATYGGSGRLYVGQDQRFVAELGYAKNRFDPYLNNRSGGGASCTSGEVNVGPEASIGYQSVSRGGFVFEALGGLAFLTNDAMARRHGQVSPAFQLKIGYLIH